MTIYDGKDFIIKIGDGEAPTENFYEIGGVTNNILKVDNQIIAKNNLADNDWSASNNNSISKSVLIEIEGIYSNSNAENILRSKAFSGENNNFEITFGNGDKINGAFLVASYSRSGAVKSEELYNSTIRSNGDIIYTTA